MIGAERFDAEFMPDMPAITLAMPALFAVMPSAYAMTTPSGETLGHRAKGPLPPRGGAARLSSSPAACQRHHQSSAFSH